MPWDRGSEEELAVCTYLDRLDKVGLHARLFVIADCANGVLRRAYVGEGPPPQVNEHRARRFLERHSEYHVRKNQSKRSTERKHEVLILFSGGFMSSRKSAMSMEYNHAIFTTSTSSGSVSVLRRTRRLLHMPLIVSLSSPSAVIPIERQSPSLKL